MVIRINDSARTIKIGVGDLVHALNDDYRFLGKGSVYSARWGQELHKRLFKRASQNNRSSEVHVSHEIEVAGYAARISGRIDLLQVEGNRTLVQEIKTVALPGREIEGLTEDDLASFRDQLRIYLYLLDCAGSSRNLEGRLLVVSILDGSIKEIPVTYRQEEVFLLIRSVLLGLLRRHEQDKSRKAYRHSFAERIQWPYESPRRYQDEAAAAVLHALEIENNLLLSAPTGMGKTAAVLLSVLQFAFEHDLWIFWASGKSSHQKIVADTLRLILPNEAPFSALFLMAKEKLCPNEVFACEEHLCPYSQDFSVKLKHSGVVETLLQQQVILPEDVSRVASEHTLCPFELSLHTASRADFIVGDYNYIFDPKVSLRRLLPPKKRKEWILVIDEAHNLYSRARGYFSPSLGRKELDEAAGMAEGRGECQPEIISLLQEVSTHIKNAGSERTRGQKQAIVEIDRDFFGRIGSRLKELVSDYFLVRLQAGAQDTDDPLAQCLLDLSAFCEVLTLQMDMQCVFDPGARGSLKLLCLDPSPQVGRLIKSFRNVIAISATLEPHRFFQDVLGFPTDETIAEALPSPFHRENRKVLIVPDISTTYRERTATAGKVAGVIREAVALRRGNYAAFFPSFAYLRIVEKHLSDFPGRLITQREGMNASEIEEGLANLKNGDDSKLILAVQGGSLAEGIDYAAHSLDGAFIVGIGLPELSLENELLKAYFEEKYSAGFQYAYLYPGMIRVIQSAGRVIRSENDTGFIILIGRRYAIPAYGSLLPRDWYDYSIEELINSDPAAEIEKFWNEIGK
jgi:DNA excision repair protein ERCC-2